MEKALTGKRIAIAGSRKTEEMSVLIEKQGGTALVRPLQGTVFLAEEQVKPELQKYMNEGADWSIFTTGIGIESLIKLSEDMSARDSFLQRIQNSQVGSRGYKTFAALKKMGIAPVAVDEDGTTNSLIKALSNFDLSNKRVMVQLHGEKAPSLMAFLQEQGASVQTILPYQHIPPEEAVVEQLCTELINGEVNAVCFTTAIQVRSLFNFAKERH
ncbi:MAG TPA: uroporphyrinogen-III synthase, partial [Chondromyces sp.]|nr:uroporphyrinogen-III synthase [Chondromyces sp.]